MRDDYIKGFINDAHRRFNGGKHLENIDLNNKNTIDDYVKLLTKEKGVHFKRNRPRADEIGLAIRTLVKRKREL